MVIIHFSAHMFYIIQICASLKFNSFLSRLISLITLIGARVIAYCCTIAWEVSHDITKSLHGLKWLINYFSSALQHGLCDMCQILKYILLGILVVIPVLTNEHYFHVQESKCFWRLSDAI
ncbi:hypothetical protein ACJX0J_006943 [Zea mays]